MVNKNDNNLPVAVIITAISVEFKAVCEHLENTDEVEHPKGCIYESGIFNGERNKWKVGVAEVGAGNVNSAIETERAIAFFNPKMVMFVGIAGGFKDDVTFGDVVVGDKAYEYESGKIKDGKILTRPECGKSTYSALGRAKAVARKDDWKERIIDTDPKNIPKVIIKPIAAGEKVIADSKSDLAEFLRAHYNDTAAVEMEGYGFYKAIEINEGISGLIVRGISDMLDNKKDKFHELAAKNASAFAFEVLSKLKI